jgi:lipoprotein-releasing system permease protein
MSLDWYIAKRYLAARRKGRFLSLITWIALGGVTVGVSALVVVLAVMDGMQKDLKANILEINPHVLIQEFGASVRMSDWRTVVAAVEKDPDVIAAAPFILSQVSVQRAGVQYSQSSNLIGVAMEGQGSAPTELEKSIRAGEVSLAPSPSGLPPMLMGSTLAQTMQVYPGDTIVVVAMENMQVSAMGALPAIRQFELTGTYTSGMYEYDSKNAYVTLADAQSLLGMDLTDQVGGVEVSVLDPEKATDVAVRLQNDLGPQRYAARSWTEVNGTLFAALKLEKIGMGLILFLIVLVAAFNIVSTLVMVVADRTREIGILKTMGMSDDGILRIFVLQGAWIGIVGTTVGSLLGVAMCLALKRWEIIKIPPEVYFVDRLPVSLDPLDLGTTILASVLIAFAATIYPSLLASRLQPVEAIRHD